MNKQEFLPIAREIQSQRFDEAVKSMDALCSALLDIALNGVGKERNKDTRKDLIKAFRDILNEAGFPKDRLNSIVKDFKESGGDITRDEHFHGLVLSILESAKNYIEGCKANDEIIDELY